MALDVLTVRQTVARLNKEGLPITEYAIRLLIKQGRIPVRFVGQKALLYFPRVTEYFRCESGSDNQPPAEEQERGRG